MLLVLVVSPTATIDVWRLLSDAAPRRFESFQPAVNIYDLHIPKNKLKTWKHPELAGSLGWGQWHTSQLFVVCRRYEVSAAKQKAMGIP